MMLSTDMRKKKLTDIKTAGESQGKQKLYYMGETQIFDVYRIDLDYPIYNRHNDRIEAEMLTWEQENSAPIGTYDDELHSKIGDFLGEHIADRISQELRSKIMGKIRGKNTKPEVIVHRLLFRLGYRFRIHYKKLVGRPDIALSKYRTDIFVHGCF